MGVFTNCSTRVPTSNVVSGGTSTANCGSINTPVSAGLRRHPANNSRAAMRKLFGSRNSFHRPHHSQEVAAVYLANILGRITFFQKRPRQVRELGNILRSEERRVGKECR